jgi:hypothetical protein
MSYEARREQLIASAVSLILDDQALSVDLLAELDELGVNINWLFKEAASTTYQENASIEGALYE